MRGTYQKNTGTNFKRFLLDMEVYQEDIGTSLKGLLLEDLNVNINNTDNRL